MSKRSQIQKEDQLLDELTELSMGLARRAAARAQKAETLEDIESAVRDFERLTQDVCASIALRHELEAERETLQRDAEQVRADLIIEEMNGPRVLH